MPRWAFIIAIPLALAPSMADARKYDNNVYRFQAEDDRFSKALSYVGLQEQINPIGGTFRRWMLRTWIDKESKAVTHQLYAVISYYNNWRYYEAAADDHAQALPVTVIARNVDGCRGMCGFSETLGIAVDDALLRDRALSGFQVKLSARSGDNLIIDVTPAQIQSQLTTDNQYLPPERAWAPPVVPTTKP